jgi:hypothetical protein
VVNLIDLVSQMFAAYGRDANEEHLRAYVSVLRHQPNNYIAKAIVDATSGGFERLPTTSEIVKLAREIETVESQQGQRNKNCHAEFVKDCYEKANKAGWNLAQRDELMEVCDAAINKRTGEMRLTFQQLKIKVSELVASVNDYRRRCATAEARGEPQPSEKLERWGWAINEPEGGEWDPKKESLWDHIKRIF